ncbi:hypothetical protein N7507_007874 [Penicillium longicatenatum]|nr:hypothetical protein N7507_007874 [Penicillium longicatenatum]
MRVTIISPILTSALAAASTLNVTVLSAQNNASTLECWALEPGFTTSSEAGTSGSKSLNLGALGGKTAGNSTWVVFMSGLANITLPNSKTHALVHGGKNGAILALDTADVSGLGHITKYPSDESTITLEIPLGEEGIPRHVVLHSGACEGVELLE